MGSSRIGVYRVGIQRPQQLFEGAGLRPICFFLFDKRPKVTLELARQVLPLLSSSTISERACPIRNASIHLESRSCAAASTSFCKSKWLVWCDCIDCQPV